MRKNEFLEDNATNEWLKSFNASTRKVYASLWADFLEFTGMMGDQILESRKVDKTHAWEKKLFEFKQWILTEKKESENSAVVATSVVRSFFAFHYLKLEFRRSESVRLTEAKRKYEDYRFTLSDLKKMFDVADLQERYIITAGKSFGMRAGDFSRLTRGDLEPYLDRPTPISIGEYTTEKENVKSFPFIDNDALPIIKLMIDKMSREGRTYASERILTYKDEIQLSRALKRVAERAGLNVGNKVVRFHCLRKFLIDRLSSVMSESKWKQIVGKKISESAYVSPDSLREDYQRAMAETCFPSEVDLMYLKQRQEASERITAKVINNEPLTEEDRTDIKRFGFRIGNKVGSPLYREKPKTERNGGASHESFMQIKESELLTYLREGYQIIHKLENGELIVKRA